MSGRKPKRPNDQVSQATNDPEQIPVMLGDQEHAVDSVQQLTASENAVQPLIAEDAAAAAASPAKRARQAAHPAAASSSSFAASQTAIPIHLSVSSAAASSGSADAVSSDVVRDSSSSSEVTSMGSSRYDALIGRLTALTERVEMLGAVPGLDVTATRGMLNDLLTELDQPQSVGFLGDTGVGKVRDTHAHNIV